MREHLKRWLPAGFKQVLVWLSQQWAPPPIDERWLADYVSVADPLERPRLTFMIQNITQATAFGGVMTGLDIFFSMAAELRRSQLWDVRIILTAPSRDTDVTIAAGPARRHGVEPADVEIRRLPLGRAAIPTRAAEIFFPFDWGCRLNLASVIEGQAERSGRMLPVVYMIQEYEPQFCAFSTAHMLAREAYDSAGRTWGIFNSSNLHAYFELLGHRTERTFIFEPIINDALRPYLSQVESRAREKRIVVYGRPTAPRNCFSAAVRGLRRWREQSVDAADWELVSAGTRHEPVTIGKGQVLRSMGKLSLEDYAELMLTSSVGLSLMASPHPSYPPLEMAHFGLRTVTNTYTCKNLSDYHPNIVSAGAISANALATALAHACQLAESPVDASTNAEFVRDHAYPFVPELAQGLLAELA